MNLSKGVGKEWWTKLVIWQSPPIVKFDESCYGISVQAWDVSSAVKSCVDLFSLGDKPRHWSDKLSVLQNQKPESYSLSHFDWAYFLELWGVSGWFLHWLCVVFQNIFNPQGMCVNVLCYVSGKIHVTSTVRRPKQFALYTFSNKLSLRELLSTKKNISPMEPCAEYCISWKPNNVGRLANNKEFGFQTFSLTSQYAVLCLKYEVISDKFLFMHFFRMKYRDLSLYFRLDRISMLLDPLINCSKGVMLKILCCLHKKQNIPFPLGQLDPISCKCCGSWGTTSYVQICPV